MKARNPPSRAVRRVRAAVALAMLAGAGRTVSVVRAGDLVAAPAVERVVHATRGPAGAPTAAPRVAASRTAAVREASHERLVAVSQGGLSIDATFDGSITGDSEGPAIEQAIEDALGVYVASFGDPIRVSIRFRFATTYADGTTPLPGVDVAVSESAIYREPWATYVGALLGDASTANDVVANGSLPGSPLSLEVLPASANGRAVGLPTPPVMFPDGSLGVGGPYDGIVTLNARASFSFTRPLRAGTFDARRFVEHEIDEVLGLGSGLDRQLVRPQDLFSWSAPGARSLATTGLRYFSIDAGATNLVGFNQEGDGDFGDWASGDCPQSTPWVQNAFACPDQASDVTPTSPEAVNLDVVGWDLIAAPATTTTTSAPTTTTTVPPCAAPVVECCPIGQPGCGACGVDCGNGGCCPFTTPVCDNDRLLCFTSGPVCGADETRCTDSALGFADVACCARPTARRACAAACSPIVAACRASCEGSPHARKCRRRCQTALVGACRRSQPSACPGAS